MTTRYQKRHYEDVASILLAHVGYVSRDLVSDFADLFAVDNPQRFTAHIACPYNHSDGRDNDCHIYGFDREQFLAACGLEPEQRERGGDPLTDECEHKVNEDWENDNESLWAHISRHGRIRDGRCGEAGCSVCGLESGG